MRCFYHPDRDAVGLCKNCAKGLCAESAIDVGDGLACPGPCEKRIEHVNSMIDKSQTIASTSASFVGDGMLTLGIVISCLGICAWIAWSDAAVGFWLVTLGAILAATPARRRLSARLRGS